MTENGFIFIEVPNILKPFRSLDHYFLRYVHLVNFSPETLKRFFAKHGFQTIYMDSAGNRGPAPKNIRLVAKKVEKETENKVQVQQNYKSVKRKLNFKRIEWLLYGQFHFKFFGLYRKMRAGLVKSKYGQFIKKLLR